jgi:uncharacterized protein (DUF58 family)
MKVDFARLNHILIPKTKDDRDRFRRSAFGRALRPFFRTWSSLTDEGRTLSVVAPIAGAVAVDVQRTSAYIVFAILFGLLFGSLIAARFLRIDRTSIVVSAPRRVTVGENVDFDVTVSGSGQARVRIRGPFLPWDGTWIGTPPDEMEAEDKPIVATMRARFVARGVHHLDSFSVAATAPLGLACGPRVESDAVKVWVVPRIANVVRLPPVVTTKHQPGGVALASKAGESMDLHGVRPYRPGDPVRDLHARTWARTGEPAVREYQQEYFTRVGVVLDTSARSEDDLEVAIELAAGVLAHLARGEALIDVLVVGDVVHELTLGRSLGRLDHALELLAAVERAKALDAKRLVRRLEPHLSQLSMVVAIVTNGDRALERELSKRGLPCTTLVIDEKVKKAIATREELRW